MTNTVELRVLERRADLKSAMEYQMGSKLPLALLYWTSTTPGRKFQSSEVRLQDTLRDARGRITARGVLYNTLQILPKVGSTREEVYFTDTEWICSILCTEYI